MRRTDAGQVRVDVPKTASHVRIPSPWRREPEMPKTFAEYTSERDAALTAEGATAVRVFDAAYAVGAALAGARRARHLTQTELARQSGVTQADISRIERGQLTPTTPTLLRLIEAMHGQLAVIVPTGDSGGEVSARRQLVALSLV